MAKAKVRVHELARELGLSSKELLTFLGDEGEFVKSASSTLEGPVVRRVRDAFANADVALAAREVEASPEAAASKATRSKSLQATPEHRRRVVAVLPRNDAPRARTNHVASVPPPSRRPSGVLDRQLYERGLLEMEAILIQSPFDPEHYEPVERAREVFALDKLLIYDRVAGLLGASSFSVEELLVHQGDDEFTIRADGKHSLVDAEASFDRQASRKFRRLLEVGSHNVPAEPNLAKAEALVIEKRLSHDPAMSHLLGTVRDGVQKKSQTLRLNLTEEASRNVTLGVKLQAALGFHGGASAEWSEKAVGDLQILLRVDFDGAPVVRQDLPPQRDHAPGPRP